MESLCRLCCTSHKKAKLIHLLDENNRHLLEKFNHFDCFTLKIVVNDILCICIRCTGLLEAAYEFKLLCESAEAKFLAVTKSSNHAVVKEEVFCSPQTEIGSEENRDKSLGFVDASKDSHFTAKANYKSDDDMKSPKLYCDMCGLYKTKKVDLANHMKVHRTSEPTSELSTDNSNRKHRWQTTGSILCDICCISFRRKRELERHTKIVHHQLTDNEKACAKPSAWICETCGKEYKSKHTLKYHINGKHVETVVKNYSCNLCNYKCREARHLVSHQQVHSGEKQHQCSECGASFGFQTSLHRHIQHVHRREKRHKCTICNQSFYTKFRLKEHFLMHNGENPQKCTLCSRTYRYANSLYKHMRKRHREARKQMKGN